MLFAYLGPNGRPPPLPKYAAACGLLAGQRSLEATRVYDYNWFNFIENGADPAHFSILHRDRSRRRHMAQLVLISKTFRISTAIETAYGMKVVLVRKPGPSADTEYVG